MSSRKETSFEQAEKGMRQAFQKQAQEIIENEERFRKDYDSVKIGLEVEYPGIDENLEPLDRDTRNQIIQDLEFADTEVGGSQIEIKTDPMVMDGRDLSDIEKELRKRESAVLEKADEQNIKVLRAGTNPFVNLESIQTTDKPKYDTVPNFHDERRNGVVHSILGTRETIDPRDADMAALINSTQTNIEASDLEDAVEKANYTYMITPFLTSITTNSRFLDGKDLGINDTRMPVWERSHDTRSEQDLGTEDVKVGKIDSYYRDINDYFERVKNDDFILHEESAAMDIGIGTFWKDSRIKFSEEPENDIYDIVVESRAVSTQPTIEEEIAVHGFYTGRILYAQGNGEELMDIEKVNRNRYAAIHNGLDTKLYGTEGDLREAEEVLEEELDKAAEGLNYAGIQGEEYLDLLYNRIDEGTPADTMAEEFYRTREQGMGKEDSILKGLEKQGAIQ